MTAFWPRRSRPARTFRRRSFTPCCGRRPPWCMTACSRRRRRRCGRRSATCSPRFPRRSARASGRAITARRRRLVLGISSSSGLNEATLSGFCRDRKFEEAVVTLAALAKVQVEIVDRLMESDRFDPVLILCKAANLTLAGREDADHAAHVGQRHVGLRARRCLRQLRAALGLDRAAGGALLAGAAGERGVRPAEARAAPADTQSQPPEDQESRADAARAPPWRDSAW